MLDTAGSRQLPTTRFRRPPGRHGARALADAVRQNFNLGAGSVETRDLLITLGWRVSEQLLWAHEGGLRASMGPSIHGGFSFVVDHRPAPDEAWMAADYSSPAALSHALVNARLAHELGHVFFYGLEAPYRRLSEHTTDEERFCDLFASYLLLPHGTPFQRGNSEDLTALTTRLGVPLGLLVATGRSQQVT